MSELSDKVRKICGDAVIKDAKEWHKSGPRRFKRSDTTQKSLGMKISKINDRIFTDQNQDADTSMRRFYEVRATRYGVFDQLPWVIEARKAERKARKESVSASECVSGTG